MIQSFSSCGGFRAAYNFEWNRRFCALTYLRKTTTLHAIALAAIGTDASKYDGADWRSISLIKAERLNCGFRHAAGSSELLIRKSEGWSNPSSHVPLDAWIYGTSAAGRMHTEVSDDRPRITPLLGAPLLHWPTWLMLLKCDRPELLPPLLTAASEVAGAQVEMRGADVFINCEPWYTAGSTIALRFNWWFDMVARWLHTHPDATSDFLETMGGLALVDDFDRQRWEAIRDVTPKMWFLVATHDAAPEWCGFVEER